MAAASAGLFSGCSLGSAPPATFELAAARLLPLPCSQASSIPSAASARRIPPRYASSWRALSGEQFCSPIGALCYAGPVAPRSTYSREGDGGRPSRMVAEGSERNGGPLAQEQRQRQQGRGPFPRPPVLLWEKDCANAVQLIGRVGRDVEIQYLGSGKVVATTALAVREGSQRTENPSWFILEIWDDLAEVAAHHVTKGELILVAGEVSVDKRVEDDVRLTIVKVVVRDLCFVEPSSERRQPYGKSNDEFTVRGSSSQSQAEVATVDSPQQNWHQQQQSSQLSKGARGHGNNVAKLEAQSPQTCAGASKWMEAAKMKEKNLIASYKVVGGVESRQENTDSLKVELKRVGDIKANLTRRITGNDALELRELEPLSREKEGRSSATSDGGVPENSIRQDLRIEELPSGRSTPTWMKVGHSLIAQGRQHTRASRDCSVDTAKGNGRTHMPSAGTTSEAIAVLQNRLKRGITTDSYAYVKVLQMCLKERDLFATKQVHDCITQSGIDEDQSVAGTLLNVYIKCGGLVDARRVFDKLKKKSVVAWTNMISGYAKSDHAECALELFNQMRQEGVEPNEITYLTVLKACTSLLALQWGKEIHERIRHAGCESDVRVATALLEMYAKCGCITEAREVFENLANRDIITWNVMIGAFAQHGCGHEAYRLFCQMRQQGFEPDAFTYVSILNEAAGALGWLKEVHGHASKAGLDSDLRVGTALVHMYAESGIIDEARLVFDRMEKRNVVTWNVMIGGLAYHGCGHEALKLFRKMNANCVKPNATSFVAVLSACCHAGLLDDGRRIFSSMMPDYGIEPNIVHYTCMVDLLGRCGHLEEAKRFIMDMQVEPDDVIWKAFLGACRTSGNVELGELAAKELFKLEPNDASAYVLLSNIYAAAGQWEKVSVVRAMMQKRGVRKEPGRSWIEIDNKIHEFVVGDVSHPEARAIYTELNTLTEKLKAEGYTPDTRVVLHDINEEEKELALCSHSEKLAIVYGLIHIPRGEPIRVTKNLRVCPDCHTATKLISRVTGREIIARDANRFHHFKDGVCSCGDYW